MQLDAPIPGGNYDQAVDYLINKIDEPEQIEVVFAMLGIDAHITTVVTTILLQAVSKGKIGIDLAILVAGPLARYIEISAKDVGMKYELGVENKDRVIITPSLLKASLGIIEQDDEELEVPEEEAPLEEPTGSLMAMPADMTAPQNEQDAMLGVETLEEEIPVEEAAVLEEELV